MELPAAIALSLKSAQISVGHGNVGGRSGTRTMTGFLSASQPPVVEAVATLVIVTEMDADAMKLLDPNAGKSNGPASGPSLSSVRTMPKTVRGVGLVTV